MANYTSDFTGQHNDDYDSRITSLLNTITEQQNTIITLNNTITQLNSTISGLTSRIDTLESNSSTIYVGSQVLIGEYIFTTSGDVGKTGLAGSPNYSFIEGVFSGRSVPSGYSKAYRLSAEASTSGNNHITLYLNQFATNEMITWSGSYYEMCVSTSIFKESDIVFANNAIYNYNTHAGCYLFYSCRGSGEFRLRGITIHGYFIKN